MRIGIYDPYLDDTGGGEKYMLTMAEFLAKNHKVTVFWNNKEDLDRAARRFSLDLESVILARNIFTSKVSTIKRLKETAKYDAIIVLSDGSIPLVRAKLFMHIQRPLEHIKLNFFDKIKMKRVSRIFCNSEFTKKFIDKTYGIHSDIIYPPVALHPLKLKKENTILHVGRFRPFDKVNGSKDYKKQYIMLNTFKEMVDQGLKNWKFVLAVSVNTEGKDAFEDMKKKADDYPIEFELNKSNQALWENYSRAKIYWHASGFGENLVEHPEYAEHFGISTVEAMGARCVPVVINAGGQKEIVKDGINGFTWDTIEELKEKTLTLIDSPKLLDTLSTEAEKKAHDFSLEKFHESLNRMINS